MSRTYLAVDLGASGGRIVAGIFDGANLRLEEGYRFDNGGIALGNAFVWDLPALWANVVSGLGQAAKKYGDSIASLGVDTWGVDFGLLGPGDEILGLPRHYRDRRTAGILEYAFGIVPKEEVFAATGTQFMEFNTLFQLLAMKRDGSGLLGAAERLLLMPDLFHFLLTGERANEYTNASTSQMIDPSTRDWAFPLIERFGLPTNILGTIASPGTRLGKLASRVATETGLKTAEVVLPPTHDTACAVLAAPAESSMGDRPSWCYISSGTWSLMGVEIHKPLVSDRCRELNFTNEGGIAGTTRLLKNIIGLWLVQECRRIWKLQGKEFGWAELVRRAENAPPFGSLIRPDDATFMAPANMPEAIREFCASTKQTVPDTEGAILRAAFESLALRYREVLRTLEELTGGPIETIHIVGGGSQNQLLNQMTADATGRRVVAGPVEATAVGNLLMQAVAMGDVESPGEGRRLVRTSFAVQQYLPRNTHLWDAAAHRFALLSKS